MTTIMPNWLRSRRYIPAMDLFNLISAPNPAKVKTGTRPRAAHEVSLLIAMANRVIDIDTTRASGSSRTPSTMEKSPLDFADEDLPSPNTKGVGIEEQIQDELSREIPSVGHAMTAEVIPEIGLEEEVATMRPPVNKRWKQIRRKRANDEAEANAPPKVLRKDHVSSPAHNAYGGKSLAAMGLGAGSISSTPSAHGAPTAAKSVSDSDLLLSSRGTATEILTEHVATTEVNIQLSAGSPKSGKSTFFPSMVRSPGGIYQPGWGVTNDCRLDTPTACQDIVDHIAPPGYFSELRHLPNADFLSQYNMNLARQVVMGSQLRLRFEQETKNLETLLEAEAHMKKAAEAKNAKLTKELESLRVRFSDLQVNNNQLSQQVSNLQAQITGEEKIKAAFEEFKKYEDDRVEQRSIAGRCWVIRHGLRLAVKKCGDTPELRQAFANVVSARLVKGMSEGLEHGIEHGKAVQDLEDVEASDPEAHSTYLKALQELKDLKYPLVDQLKGLKDAPMDTSQLKIPVYPEVRDPRNPWAIKEEILLEDAIAANVSHVEKKNKCRVVCRTHGVGSAHHARSDDIPVSTPNVAPQGLAILLVDVAT
ncbi:hypothetical protein Tco_1112286 [Tanacetum coccineum]|uniref:Transposase (Putative), gypsy type n=1 Tax=Tanacetum coccineum TaxID=301880 RepID=A0ABQ5IRP0_9ASTR